MKKVFPFGKVRRGWFVCVVVYLSLKRLRNRGDEKSFRTQENLTVLQLSWGLHSSVVRCCGSLWVPSTVLQKQKPTVKNPSSVQRCVELPLGWAVPSTAWCLNYPQQWGQHCSKNQEDWVLVLKRLQTRSHTLLWWAMWMRWAGRAPAVRQCWGLQTFPSWYFWSITGTWKSLGLKKKTKFLFALDSWEIKTLERLPSP